MAKPICLIKAIPTAYGSVNSGNLIAELNHILGERMPDYHVFVIPQEDYTEHHDALEFQVFYEKDFTETQYAELKKIIEDSIK